MSNDTGISIKAIVLGSIVDLVGTMVISAILGMAFRATMMFGWLPADRMGDWLESPLVFTAVAVPGLATTCLGGFVAGHSAARLSLLHGTIVGGLSIVWGMLLNEAPLGPGLVLGMAMSLPAGTAGGWLAKPPKGGVTDV